MSMFSRPVLFGALILILLTSGCGALTRGAPTPVWTIPPQGTVVAPTPTIVVSVTATETLVAPEIPITGENVVSMQCQFCVEAETHAILVFPDLAYFDVDPGSGATCLTADVVNGKRILICRGPQSSSFNLNICSDPTNCLQFPVALQPCPLLQAGATPLATYTPFAPVYLTPINTLKAPVKKATGTPTPGAAVPSSTSTPGDTTATPIAPLPTNTAPVLPTLPPPSTPTPVAPTETAPPSLTEPATAPTEPPVPSPTSHGSGASLEAYVYFQVQTGRLIDAILS